MCSHTLPHKNVPTHVAIWSTLIMVNKPWNFKLRYHVTPQIWYSLCEYAKSICHKIHDDNYNQAIRVKRAKANAIERGKHWTIRCERERDKKKESEKRNRKGNSKQCVYVRERDCLQYIIVQTYDVGLHFRRHPVEYYGLSHHFMLFRIILCSMVFHIILCSFASFHARSFASFYAPSS